MEVAFVMGLLVFQSLTPAHVVLRLLVLLVLLLTDEIAGMPRLALRELSFSNLCYKVEHFDIKCMRI